MVGLIRAAGLHPHRVTFTSGGQPGHRIIWATGGRQARWLILSYPSSFGLHESVTVHSVMRLDVREQTVRKDTQRAA